MKTIWIDDNYFNARSMDVYITKLRKLLNLRSQRRDLTDLEAALVTEHSISNWVSTLTVNRGTQHGVEVNDCVIDETGALVGGCICPGVKISMDALTDRTALLPGLQLDQPKKAIGRNTIDCMRSGIMMGTACMLDGMVERMEAELGCKTTVIATGGIAKFVLPMCKKKIIYDKDLLVKGLATLYRENKRS